MQALLRQLRHDIQQYETKKIQSLFIGGGTPSTVPPKLYEPLFEAITPLLCKECEITIEANPNSATRRWMEQMRAMGVNRISFGVQSFDDEKLKFLGRAHSSKDAILAIENAKKEGFEHISLDLIYDTAMDSKELLKSDIDQALSLPIDHISAYALTIEENTPFASTPNVRRGDEDLGYLIKEIIPFEQYEVSNFGQFRSRHNLGYWRLEKYLGVGCGAVGFVDGKRLYPHNDLFEYIKNPLYKQTETLSEEDLRFEKIFLGLRSIVGVEKELLDPKKVQILLEEGKLIQKGDQVFNTNFFLADELALYLED